MPMPMPMPITTDRPAVDVSDRAAAVDRYARLSLVDGLLRELERFGDSEPGHPEYGDRSPRADAIRRSLDWLGDLPEGFSLDDDGVDPIAEMNSLHNALFAHDIPDADGNPDPEYDLANARGRAMTARLLVRIAEHPDWLRERAAELLLQADEGMQSAAEAMAAVQEMYERSGAVKTQEGGDDA